MPDQPTYADVLLSAVKAFDYANFDTPQLDARLLLSHAANLSHAELISSFKDPVSDEVQKMFAEYVTRRLVHEPVHRITNVREFFGREFFLNASSLIPRPDTETLIEAVLSVVCNRNEVMRILDLGTGSGVIAVTLACELKNSDVFAVDVSEEALDVCDQNAARLCGPGRVETIHSDMFDNVTGKFDLIVSNPPYIPTGDIERLAPEVRIHDPRVALDGGEDGFDFYRQIFKDSSLYLQEGGFLAVEHGFDQGQTLNSMATAFGLRNVKTYEDLAGHPRVLIANC